MKRSLLLFFFMVPSSMQSMDSKSNSPIFKKPRLSLESVETHEELIKAAQKGNVAKLKAALDRGASVNEVDSEGCTALHWALINRYAEIVELLISAGADSDIQDVYGKNGIHLAIQYANSMNVFKSVLKAASQDGLDATDVAGRTPLHCAIKDGLAKHVKILVSLNCNCMVFDRYGYLPLHLALKKSNKTKTRLLLYQNIAKQAVNMQARNEHGNTALHFSVMQPQQAFTLTELLLKAHADINSKNSKHETPLELLLKGRNHDDVPLVQLLLQNGASLRLCSESGRTLMHTYLSTLCVHSDIFNALLSADSALVSFKDAQGNTLLHCVTHTIQRHFPHQVEDILGIIKWLLFYGADADSLNNAHNTPALELLCQQGPLPIEVLQLFLQNTQSVFSQNVRGYTIISYLHTLLCYHATPALQQLILHYAGALALSAANNTSNSLSYSLESGYVVCVAKVLKNKHVNVKEELICLTRAHQLYNQTQNPAYKTMGKLLLNRLIKHKALQVILTGSQAKLEPGDELRYTGMQVPYFSQDIAHRIASYAV
ncbi:ankyrin repeat domain-containing protein [Candidatus Dependentiae bacterium]|nr:ankyrin repeat domain-containing protein [Candidatus Dependentiae bacterium]